MVKCFDAAPRTIAEEIVALSATVDRPVTPIAPDQDPIAALGPALDRAHALAFEYLASCRRGR
jgi:hypothetical protein